MDKEEMRFKVKVIALLASIALFSSVSLAKYSGGAGEPNDPYQIATAYDLYVIGGEVNDFNKCFILTNDIDLDPNLPGGSIFSPAVIALDARKPFTGVFDGGGHKITNVVILGSNNYAGFFGYVNGGVIKNLGIENVEIIFSSNRTGGIAGMNNAGIISNCCVTFDINSPDDSNAVGGLVGFNTGVISNCFSAGNLRGGSYSIFFGGIAGRNDGSINDCFSQGFISVGTVYGRSDAIGGLAGINNGNIENCFSENTIEITGGYSYNTGGLAGFNAGNIDQCGSSNIITVGILPSYIGGLTGYNSAGNISNCYSTGEITSGKSATCIGGLTGVSVNNGNISNCASFVTINCGINSICIGGLTGANGNDANDSNIINCFAAGDINAGSGTGFIGGLAGGFKSGNIISSYFLDTTGPDNGYGEPLTDEQMKQQASFIGWDFVWETANGTEDIWAICEGVSYPKLAWQYIVGDSDNNKTVDFVDFALMGEKWMQEDLNLYCGGTDLTGDEWVDWDDLKAFVENWLE